MAIKSATCEEETNTNMNTNSNHGSGGPGEEEEPEEGEIVGGDGESKQSTTAVVHQPHPLEHSWTSGSKTPPPSPRGPLGVAPLGRSIPSLPVKSSGENFGWSGGNEGVPMDPFYDDLQIDDRHKEFQCILGDGRNIYNNIPHPSKLTMGADFHCFKHKIEPKWEDPVCANGGKWTATFTKGKSDTCWLYTLLAMIGEQFDHGDEICGAVVNVRARQEKVALWTKNARNEAAQMSIGKQWKEFLDYNETVGFMFHEDAKRLVRTAKNRYTI